MGAWQKLVKKNQEITALRSGQCLVVRRLFRSLRIHGQQTTDWPLAHPGGKIVIAIVANPVVFWIPAS